VTSPAELSPEPTSEVSPAALPFGVTWAELSDGLPGFVSGGTARISHRRRGRHRGGRQCVIMTLTYTGDGGQPLEKTVFFKLNADDSRERDTYSYLAQLGVPVPRLVLQLDHADHEVLGLEFLPSVGVRPDDVDPLLRLTASLNAATDVPPTIAATGSGLPQDEFEQLLETAVVEVAARWPEHRPASWFDLYRRAVDVHRTLPRALTHGELAAQHVGRTLDGQLVVVDWETAGLRARFADVANILEVLGQLSGEDERTVLSRYLGHLRAAGGVICSIEQAWAEVRLTRFVQELEALPWRTSLDDPADLQRHVETIAGDHPAVLGRLSG
jgi:hypothetical protein